MGKAKAPKSSDSGWSSSDYDDDVQPELDLDRYQAAEIRQGLLSRQYRLTATRELLAIIMQGYRSAAKKLQNTIYEDLLVAAKQPDRRPQVVETVSELMTAAKRILPQQKRNQLLKEHKQAAVAANRAKRHAGTPGCSYSCRETDHDAEDEEELPVVVLGDVPLEVVQGILKALDPASLAAAACVCRSWHALATADDMWQAHVHNTFPAIAKQWQRQCRQQQQHEDSAVSCSSPGSANDRSRPCTGGSDAPRGALHRKFCTAAKSHPHFVLPWRSCRVLVRGRLQWVPPGMATVSAVAAGRAARHGVVSPGPVHVSTEQAVRWLMGSSWTEVFADDISSSSEGASSDQSDGEELHAPGERGAAAMLRLWQIRP